MDDLLARARLRTTNALVEVEENADAQWKKDAWATIVQYLKTHEELFVDDFWEQSGLAFPREARALGPVFVKASRDGLMEKSGRYRPSVRSNLTEKPVWKSLIFGS